MGQSLSIRQVAGISLPVLTVEDLKPVLMAALPHMPVLVVAGEDVPELTVCAVMGPHLFMMEIDLHHPVLGVGQCVILISVEGGGGGNDGHEDRLL